MACRKRGRLGLDNILTAATARYREHVMITMESIMNQFEYVEVLHGEMMFSSMEMSFEHAEIFQWWPQH